MNTDYDVISLQLGDIVEIKTKFKSEYTNENYLDKIFKKYSSEEFLSFVERRLGFELKNSGIITRIFGDLCEIKFFCKETRTWGSQLYKTEHLKLTTLNKLYIDPPSGWRYGFPKEFIEEDCHNLELWLIANGYPEKDAEFGAKYARWWRE